jgi:hypothetical protein
MEKRVIQILLLVLFQTLLEEYKNGRIVLGKIDVYQKPVNHIYLTDGQQRITTIYLLIGMLHRIVAETELKNKLRKCLISDFELNDDFEPYLQYAIRESSVFFIRDLVCDFFQAQENFTDIKKVEDIPEQSWFFVDYEVDPTINSMLAALGTIEKLLSEKDIDYKLLAEFILHKLMIQYYDVEDKKHGEERFVIINTTGRSLTVAENIKPILLGNTVDNEFNNQWEERENWFWKNRNNNKSKNELVADEGVKDFLTWCFQIILKQEDIDLQKQSKKISSDKNQNYIFLKDAEEIFVALKKFLMLLNNNFVHQQLFYINDNKEVDGILGIRLLTKDKINNIILPVLFFIKKISDKENDVNQFIRRLRKNYFDKKWNERNSNYVDWRHIIQIIEFSENEEQVLTFETLKNSDRLAKISNVPLNEWYNEEEKIKRELKKQFSVKIQEWEDHLDFMGDLSPLFKAAQNSTDAAVLQKFYETYDKIQKKAIDYSNRICNIYRLLAYLQNGIPEARE